jgi:hypothetical protein
VLFEKTLVYLCFEKYVYDRFFEKSVYFRRIRTETYEILHPAYRAKTSKTSDSGVYFFPPVVPEFPTYAEVKANPRSPQ